MTWKEEVCYQKLVHFLQGVHRSSFCALHWIWICVAFFRPGALNTPGWLGWAVFSQETTRRSDAEKFSYSKECPSRWNSIVPNRQWVHAGHQGTRTRAAPRFPPVPSTKSSGGSFLQHPIWLQLHERGPTQDCQSPAAAEPSQIHRTLFPKVISYILMTKLVKLFAFKSFFFNRCACWQLHARLTNNWEEKLKFHIVMPAWLDLQLEWLKN